MTKCSIRNGHGEELKVMERYILEKDLVCKIIPKREVSKTIDHISKSLRYGQEAVQSIPAEKEGSKGR